MQRFWNYVQTNPPKTTLKSQRVAYVLPNAYGFGFRWPTDHIWGIWEADAISSNISKSVGALLTQYGSQIDIIYDDGLQEGNNGYNQLIYWNNYYPNPTPSPTPTPSPIPTTTSTPDPTEPPPNYFPQTLVVVLAVMISAVFAGTVLFVYFKRQKVKQ